MDIRIRSRTRNGGGSLQADFDNPLAVYGHELPAGATPFYITDTAAAGAMENIVTLAAGERAYVLGWGVDGKGATASATINVTIAGLLGGTLTMPYRVAIGATALAIPMRVDLPFAWPGALADGTDIDMDVPSFGAGNTDAYSWIYGYILAD